MSSIVALLAPRLAADSPGWHSVQLNCIDDRSEAILFHLGLFILEEISTA